MMSDKKIIPEKISPLNLARLRELAACAVQDWWVDEEDGVLYGVHCTLNGIHSSIMLYPQNERFIAAACPANVLALIARCEHAEALLEEARKTIHGFMSTYAADASIPAPGGCADCWSASRATLARIDAAMGAGGER